MRSVPTWFKGELKRFDPAMKIRYDEQADCFDIIKEIAYFPAGSKKLMRETVIRATFKRLDDAAMTEIKRRNKHWQGVLQCSAERQMKEISDMNKEAKMKKREYAAELVATGICEADWLKRRHTVS